MRSLGERLLVAFGPFFVQGMRSTRAPRRPLLQLAPLLEAAKESHPMASRLVTSDRAFDYAVWASRRLGSGRLSSPSSIKAAEACAERHGLAEPLHLSLAVKPGHGRCWASKADWIDAYLCGESPCMSSMASMASLEKEKNADGTRRRRRRQLPTAVRMAVWNRWIGFELGIGPCFCCGRQIAQQDFECGHVVASALGGSDDASNLRPVCRTCNRSMGVRHLDEFARSVRCASAHQPGLKNTLWDNMHNMNNMDID